MSDRMIIGESNRCGVLLLPLVESESVIGEQGEKKWGSGKRIGGLVMKGKEIGRLLGDNKGEGGVWLHKTKINTRVLFN